ncbi:hypothetical protein V6N11_054780 [Hibiscus sabdariffa]|uniref:RNase H type-1 domain-containing protein n=1 Tax=Hibiscus sabdariffa TaxID=183260 RepID=A0ABR2S4Y7_9ROSI
MVTELGAWDWQLLSHLLPDMVLRKIAAIRPPSIVREGCARLVLGRVSKFSLKSAYKAIDNVPLDECNVDWKFIWKLNIPQRIRVLEAFRSLLVQDELLRPHVPWCLPEIGWVKINCDGAIEVEIDSLETCRISNHLSESLANSNLVVAIHELCQRSWRVAIQHIRREANAVADKMAVVVRDLPVGVAAYTAPPEFILTLLHDDLSLIV